jgi:iron-sulfur cluster assembly protein
MLALTENAVEAIEGILEGPAIPDGAGLRIAAMESANGTGAQLQLMLAEGPAESDEVIDDGGARVFIEGATAEFLDDKLLDADVLGEEVQFAITAQAA